MRCMVCRSGLEPYFEKNFRGFHGLEIVRYERCPDCGFVGSRTHAEMSEDAWERLNRSCHSTYQGTKENPPEDPRWLTRLRAQAEAIRGLARVGIVPADLPWVDYGCGDGTLSEHLAAFDLELLRFDRYMAGAGYLTAGELLGRRYGLVVNTSVFEHVRERAPLDQMAALIAPSGVFAIHTLVREEIPRDAEWFYLLPVHCALFTNRAMQKLFDQWGFAWSAYHLESRLWFWFRQESEGLRRFMQRPGAVLPGEVHFKRGFVDHWK